MIDGLLLCLAVLTSFFMDVKQALDAIMASTPSGDG
jgi:hypothetical protein